MIKMPGMSATLGIDREPGAGPVMDGLSMWHVLHVKSRQEKALSEDLCAMGVAHFLPLLCQTRYWANRKSRVEEPLFPGYLFLFGTIEQAYRADRTRRVARVIEVHDQRQIEWELQNIRLALRQDATLTTYPFLKKGVRVEVRSGPMRGLQGVIEDRTKDNRLILQVKMLGRAVSLEIDGSLLDVLD